MSLRATLTIWVLLIFSASSWALDSIEVLPHGIASPAFKQGFISSLNQKYTDKGLLINLSDINSFELDLTTLKGIEPEVSLLEDALNQFGNNNFGSDIHLGVLKVESSPVVIYSAPVFAYGVSTSWTLGLGIPIINYQNELGFSHRGSNIPQLREQLYGLSSDLDSAFDLLSNDASKSAQQTLISKGYKPIESREETFIGDVQLVSLWQVFRSLDWGAQLKSTVSLPSGPKDKADDLTDLPGFGQTALENQLVTNYFLLPWLTLSARGGYKWVLPDNIEKRVPTDSTDTLPDSSRKTSVDRNIGDSLMLAGGATVNLKSGFSFGSGLELGSKFSDKYSGSLSGDYSALEANTYAKWQKTYFELSYSSVAKYFSKLSLFPAIFSINYSDTIAGINIERQSVTELNATLFF